jgi:hypothetical protein
MKTCKQGFEGLKYSLIIICMILISGFQSENAETDPIRNTPLESQSGNGQTVTYNFLKGEY